MFLAIVLRVEAVVPTVAGVAGPGPHRGPPPGYTGPPGNPGNFPNVPNHLSPFDYFYGQNVP